MRPLASLFTFLLGATTIAFVVAACGSETTGDVTDAGSSDSTTSGDSGSDVLVIVDATTESDADPPADGPFACGSTTCSATQYCVNPCCGGAGDPGCTPPPPYCIDDTSTAPAGCMKNGHEYMCICG